MKNTMTVKDDMFVNVASTRGAVIAVLRIVSPVLMALCFWILNDINDKIDVIATKVDDNKKRISSLESTAFTRMEAETMKDDINENHVKNIRAISILEGLKDDMSEIKLILKRTAPYERKEI